MKMKSAFLFLCLLATGLLTQVFGQDLTITGKVSNKKTGEVLQGASVSTKENSNKVITSSKGTFKITCPNGGTLVIRYVGMTTKEVKVNGAEPLDIQLEESSESLNDVVVIGYGTQKVTKVSGAIASVKAADIEKMAPQRAEEVLQGRTSGVTVIQSGSPGSAPTVLIRGITSYAGLEPTVIIDGVPQTLTDFNSINPGDIESVNVLKDAATTAIYGVKGGNGVIVVTTKSGRKNQKPEISFNGTYGIQSVANKIGVLNATEYAAIVNEGSSTSLNGGIVFPDLTKVGVGTNWQDQIFKDAPLQSYSVSVRGGAEKMSYFLSGAYNSQGGIVGGYDKSRFDRGNFTANLNFDLSSKVKFLFDVSGVVLSSKTVAENAFNSIIGSAINYDPTVPVLNTTGTVGTYGFSTLQKSEIFNPLTLLDNTYNDNSGQKVYGKFELQYDPIKNLKLTARFGYTKYDGVGKSFTPLVFYGLNNTGNTMEADGSTTIGAHNSVSNSKSSNFNWTADFFANYTFRVNNVHHFETLLGTTIQKITGNAAGTSAQDVPFNSYDYADYTAATSDNSVNLNSKTGYYYEYFNKHISYFTRINYDYNERYLASFLARRDGSTSFGTANKFGNFFAGSLGWVVSKENFFKSNFINFLKIRGSYGSLGNDGNIQPQYVQIITGGSSYVPPFYNSNGYNFNNIFYPGSTIGSAVNNALSWEKQLQGNIGFDMTFYKNKFSITFDYFEKSVDGLLFRPTGSQYLGTIPVPDGNIGSTKTTGFDITLSYNNKFNKNLLVSTSLTFTTSSNLVTATNADGTARYPGGYYFNGQSQNVTFFEKGQTPGYFSGYKTAGLFQNAAQIAAAATQTGAQPGDIRYVDVNGDGKIDVNDKTKIGDPFPKFTMGWNLSIEYKHFDFTSFVYASVGNDIYRAYERNANFTNKDRRVLARWTGEGTTNDAKNPRYSFDDANNNARVSDRFVEDGSFVKIKNIQLGYTFSSSVIKKAFSKVRIYAQIKNAYTFTNYTGFDPEISGGIADTGVDRGAYPQARIYSFGLDIKL